MAATVKAHVVVCSRPFVSHFTPMRTIAQHLVDLAYQVTFITSSHIHSKVEESELHSWNHQDGKTSTTALSLRTLNLKPSNQSSLQTLPTTPQTHHHPPEFHGALPILLGAPGYRPNGVMQVGIFPILSLGVDTAPPASGRLPPSSPFGRERNEELNRTYFSLWSSMQTELNNALTSLGARVAEECRHNAVISLSDIFLQLCPPSLEYSRSDIPPSLKFTGGLPRDHSMTTKSANELPEWWEEIVQNSGKGRGERKRVIAVSQGSMALNCTDLIIPTLNALRNELDILVLVALGKKGASLPEEFMVQGNTRVADWIPFDDLEVSDVFVTNGDYGSFQNAVSKAFYLVVAAPLFADKRDIADRVEWSGVGINLRTGTPRPGAMRESVLEVLQDEKYRRRVEEVRGGLEGMILMKVIAGAIVGWEVNDLLGVVVGNVDVCDCT
ncbi:UDP-Glycosyltransferase/glycogen phosphorylase [Acephala macrosclerotiorum]|nr:UDP-Glycosyltransferase/glycogen phosphorylase [Acephala macrosclerotiorum]